MGSSPLTRGKPSPRREVVDPGRLIPAHAGKTSRRTAASSTSWAHPRSRGENSHAAWRAGTTLGSSPLTRGKQSFQVVIIFPSGLIPAHAGKTESAAGRDRPRSAHPRSRGENRPHASHSAAIAGSSPLTRGKPLSRVSRTARTRLIPAHAGKTLISLMVVIGGPAHPRSRGENVNTITSARAIEGSSPLTRGKHSARRRSRR